MAAWAGCLRKKNGSSKPCVEIGVCLFVRFYLGEPESGDGLSLKSTGDKCFQDI